MAGAVVGFGEGVEQLHDRARRGERLRYRLRPLDQEPAILLPHGPLLQASRTGHPLVVDGGDHREESRPSGRGRTRGNFSWSAIVGQRLGRGSLPGRASPLRLGLRFHATLGRVDERREGPRIIHREIGQDLSVQL